jgi:hypothetical protein
VPKDAKVVQVAKGQYVQLTRDKTDRIFVLLVDMPRPYRGSPQ